MKINFKYTLYFVFILNLFGCTKHFQKEDSDVYYIPLEKEISEKSRNNLIQEYWKVKTFDLEETDSTVLTNNLRLFNISESELWFTDKSKIFRFNPKGHCEVIISRNGEGPEDYLGIMNASMLPNSNITVLDFERGNILEYTQSGKWINRNKGSYGGMISIPRGLMTVAIPKGPSIPIQAFFINEKLEVVDSIPVAQGIDVSKGFINIPGLIKINDKAGIIWNDTVKIINQDHALQSFLIFETGNLTLPQEIATDFALSDKRNEYISGIYPIIWDDLVFLQFYYREKIYFDIWDIINSKLIFRNIVDGPEGTYGFPLKGSDGYIYNVWPQYVQNGKLVGIIDYEFQNQSNINQQETLNPKIFIISNKN